MTSPRPTRLPPLAGFRILDFSTRTPGPICTQTLGDLGADVIKVEPPAGDYTRGMRGEFEAANRNKRSIVLDLKQPAAVDVTHRLAATCDALVETFQPGVAARLGVGVRALRRIKPDLVYCSLTNFGQTGPRKGDAGHDLEFLALAGGLSPASWSAKGPSRSPLAVVDIAAGLYAAIAVQAALLRRATSGVGAHLDVTLAGAALAATAFRPTLFEPGGERLHLSPLNDVFAARDGRLLALTVIGETSWRRLRDALAPIEPALLEPCFENEAARRAAGDELHGLLEAVFSTRNRSRWMGILHAAGVAAEPVLSGAEALRRPDLRHSDLLEEGAGPDRVRFPVAVDSAHMKVRRRPPRIGEHTREVLFEVGLSESKVEQLLATGAAGAESAAG